MQDDAVTVGMRVLRGEERSALVLRCRGRYAERTATCVRQTPRVERVCMQLTFYHDVSSVEFLAEGKFRVGWGSRKRGTPGSERGTQLDD